MCIKTLSRNDSIKCRVIGSNKNGCFLSIIGINESPTVRLFDCYIPKGSIVLVSIVRMTETYIKVHLDSVMNLRDYSFVA